MTMRIARLDKLGYAVKAEGIRRLVAAQLDKSTTSYTDRKLKFSILCGSIQISLRSLYGYPSLGVSLFEHLS